MPIVEYRIVAHFTQVYLPRSYKRKIYKSFAEAMADWKIALGYYSKYRYFDRLVLESRVVTEWDERKLGTE